MSKAFEETRAKAAYDRSVSVAIDLIKLGVNTLEQIAMVTRLPLEKVQELASLKSA